MKRRVARPARFTKMAGAGNDFLVFDELVDSGPRDPETIRKLCRRGTGVGADGVLLVSVREERRSARVLLDYYNADGGTARFCANGTRCAARFAHVRVGAPREVVVTTGWGDIPASVHANGEVTLRLPEPVAIGRTLEIPPPAGLVWESEAAVVDVGVPHLVVFLGADEDIDSLNVDRRGRPLRHHPGLEDGANINFTSLRKGGGLSVRSYERGVEAETLSCGSGIVAAAIVASVRSGLASPVKVATRSGAELAVAFELDGQLATGVTLTGDARFVFDGVLCEDAL